MKKQQDLIRYCMVDKITTKIAELEYSIKILKQELEEKQSMVQKLALELLKLKAQGE